MMSLALRSIFDHTSNGFLTCRKILQHGTDSFASPFKEVLLMIFIALKNPSLSAGIEPANLGSNGKHSSHCFTKDDIMTL
jgi:hypothetical protein